MKTVSIKNGKDHFPELVRKAESGETITNTRNGTPVAEMTAVKKKRYAIDWDAGERYLREHGIKRKKGWIAPDFDDPLPEDFLITPLPEDFDKPKRRPKK
jgi:antitoxin (DNA-binding transcriptional repressor) of toxin-antitoxin stability system